MPHTVVRRRANGETDEEIQPQTCSSPPAATRGTAPASGLYSIYRALTEYEKGPDVQFASRDELAAAIGTFVLAYDQHDAKPYRWTYGGSPLKAA
ncbi:hypothetical protein [Streptomyces sp. NBC_01431]|uniref:hypothetical protein n=1 Tax=Streptomyces sp. NBC_01431 TaxID=2903863 RepID=UPI003FCD15C2